MADEFADQVVAVHLVLEEAGIPHAFGGAIALGYYTLAPRATDDIDINIAAGKGDAKRVFAALPAQVKWKMNVIGIAQVSGQARVRWLKGTLIDLFFAVRTSLLARADHLQPRREPLAMVYRPLENF
ncbi:MAG: hypothetical protein ACYDGY_06135 [Acidimicrobiales bacterium]